MVAAEIGKFNESDNERQEVKDSLKGDDELHIEWTTTSYKLHLAKNDSLGHKREVIIIHNTPLRYRAWS